jgi:tetratricopeptide (TPR) repeat protein
MSLDRTGYADKCKAAYERTIDLARAEGAKKALGAALIATAQLVDYWPDYYAQAAAHLDEAEAIAKEIGDEELDIDVASWRMRDDLYKAEEVLERLIARRDPIRLNAHYFRMMWFTLSAGKPERCVEICEAATELAYRIGTLPVQYPTIKAFALMELGRFGDAWSSLDQEIADEAHRFAAALQDMGRFQYELYVGDFEAALVRAPGVMLEAKAVARAWMLIWVGRALAEFAPAFTGDSKTLDRIQALIADSGYPLGPTAQAALTLALGDPAGARDALARGKEGGWPTVNAGLTRAALAAEIEVAAGAWRAALTAVMTAVALARKTSSSNKLWRVLGLKATIETALNEAGAAAASRAEARALLAEIAATVPDPRHLATLTEGPIAASVGLVD